MTVKLQHGQQVQIKGKYSYHQDATVGTLKGFYEENPTLGEFNQEAIDNELSKWGGKVYWINLNAGVLTSDRAYNQAQGEKRDQSVHLNVGDTVELEGQLFTIQNDHNNNFKFVAVPSIDVSQCEAKAGDEDSFSNLDV